MNILFGCERGGKFRQYKKDIDISWSGTRKCDYSFKLWAKPLKYGEGWTIELICGSHNHDLAETLVLMKRLWCRIWLYDFSEAKKYFTNHEREKWEECDDDKTSL